MTVAEPRFLVAGKPAPERFHDPDLRSFSEFIRFFCGVFQQRDFLSGVACSEYIRAYVPKYYARTFGTGDGRLQARHLKWFRRLRAVRALPRGSTIVDYGGGYGLDSIFLASLGYKVVFYEITLDHIAVAEHLRATWERHHGPLAMRSILASSDGAPEPFGHVDAVILDEVAHHIEPAEAVFRKCAEILGPGGQVFLLEPNFYSLPTQLYFLRVRGLKTTIVKTDPATGKEFLYGNEHIRPSFGWRRIAATAGFRLASANYVVPYRLKGEASLRSRVRAFLEKAPGIRHLVGSHVTYRFEKGA